MGHSIALNFEDGVTRFIECRPDETIADASYHLGINIPLDCRDGVCGTCKCRVEAGEYDRGNYLDDALTGEEATAGLALACQTRPKTDLVISIAASSEACKTRGQTYRARLHSVDRISGTTIAFSLDGADAVSIWLSEQSVITTNFYYERFSPSGAAATIGEAQPALGLHRSCS
jgi:benzoate/toluate 1,2-dioxygenase reductase subunit